MWIQRGDVRISTLDLFQSGWVLVTEDPRWKAAVEGASQISGVAVECIVVGQDVRELEPASLAVAYGTGISGASLVRPDGYVAWRAQGLPPSPGEALDAALRQVAHPLA